MDGVAFIQTTVEVSTVARLGDNHESEQFHFVEHYFRETMLMELECKLQVLVGFRAFKSYKCSGTASPTKAALDSCLSDASVAHQRTGDGRAFPEGQ